MRSCLDITHLLYLLPLCLAQSCHAEPGDLHRRIIELQELAEANLAESTERQKKYYVGHLKALVKFSVGQQVLLNNAVKGKLDPRWTGPWEVMGLKGTTTVQLKMGDSEHTIHINRVRPLLTEPSERLEPPHTWTPPLFHHETQQAPAALRLPGFPEDPGPPNPNTQSQCTSLKHPWMPLLYQ